MALNPSGGNASGKNQSHVEMQPDALHDGAPGGRYFNESELPVAGTFNTPMTLGGFSPSPTNSPQLSSEQAGMNIGVAPPTGLRR